MQDLVPVQCATREDIQRQNASRVHALPSLGDLVKAQKLDPDLQQVRRWIDQGRKSKKQKDLPSAWRGLANYLEIKHDLVWYTPMPRLVLEGEMMSVIAVPKESVPAILHAFHSDELLAHPNVRRMRSLLRRQFYWPSLRADVHRPFFWGVEYSCPDRPLTSALRTRPPALMRLRSGSSSSSYYQA